MTFFERVKRDDVAMPAVALWAAYAALMLVTAYRSHFAILANDAFPLLFQAESLSWSEPRSFYNGFFPIGYPITLRILLLFGRQHVDATGVLLNVVLSLGLVWAMLRSLRDQGLQVWWAALATTAALFMPEMVRGVLSLRPDWIVTVLASLALLAFRRERYQIVGALLGMTCLFRTHALALVAAFCIAAILIRDWRSAVKIATWAMPFVLLQGLINVWAGESFFASSQGFNVAKMIYGADWRQDPAAVPSAVSVILSHPGAVLQGYFGHLLSEWYLLFPLAVALFFRRSREIAVIALIYLLAVALGASPRGSLPVQPFVVLAMIAVLQPVIDRRRIAGSRWIPALGIVGIFAGSLFILPRSAEKAGNRIERYQDVGDRLSLRSTDDAKRILTDDYAMYFPQIENASPFVNGGWGLIGIPLYRERMMQFMQDNANDLHQALSIRGVYYVVLSQPSGDTRLEQVVNSDTTRFERLPDISGYAVHRVR